MWTSLLPILAGAGLLLVTGADMVRTVLWAGGGGGALTTRIAEYEWRFVLFLHTRLHSGAQMQVGGILIAISAVLAWILALWAGWWLIFFGTGNIVSTSSGEAANFWDTGYYAGYLLLTLGNGEFSPAHPAVKMLTIFATMSGLAIITLAITYLMPLVSAVTQRRAVAATIEAIGGDPSGIVIRACGGNAAAGVTTLSDSLAQELISISEQHLTYPVLHYFRADRTAVAFAPRLAALDEALLIIYSAVHPAQRPDTAALETLREGIGRLLSVLKTHPVHESQAPPPPVDIAHLRDHGLIIDEEAYHHALRRHEARRRALAGFVAHAGWDWRAGVWEELQGDEPEE